MATTAELAASIASLIATLGKAYAIVNGPASGAGSTVSTANGDLPTFAKKLSAALEVSVTTASVLGQIKGALADATKIGAEYMPSVLTPNYLSLTNQAGFVIPANAIGQKNGVLYFGNTPAFNGRVKFFEQCLNNAAVILGAFVIPAEAIGDGKSIWVDINLIYHTNTLGADPGTVAVCLDWLSGATNDLTTGLIIQIPLDSRGRLRLAGIVTLLEINPNTLSLDGSNLDVAGASITKTSATAAFNAVTEKTTGIVVSTYAEAIPSAASATLRVRIVSYQGVHANGATIRVAGECLVIPI